MKASIEVQNVKGEVELKSQEAKDMLNYLIPDFCKDGIGILNDLVKSWRWKNQIIILQKAKSFLKNNNLEPKEVPLKILIPLLEKSSLEEDESLQNRWAKLLAYACTVNEIEYTKSFMGILEQLTPLEARILSWIYNEKQSESNKKFSINDMLLVFQIDKDKLEIILDNFVRLGILVHVTRGNSINTGQKISTVQNIRPTGSFKMTIFGQSFLDVCESSIYDI